MNDIQNKIDVIKAKLSSQEDGDFSYMTEEVRELRHYVMYTHGALESSMDVRIGQYLIKDIPSTITNDKERHGFYWKLKILVDEMDFAKKVKVLEKYEFLPKDLISKLWAVNQIRVYFSHPSSHLEKLKSYEDEGEYLKILEKLDGAMSAMNELILSEHPEWGFPNKKDDTGDMFSEAKERRRKILEDARKKV